MYIITLKNRGNLNNEHGKKIMKTSINIRERDSNFVI
jgi:hypothetical protein